MPDFISNTSWIAYNEHKHERGTYEKIEDINALNDPNEVRWVNTYGTEFREEVKQVVNQNNLDSFLCKLMVDATHPNKVLELDDILFVAVSVLKTDHSELISEQMFFINSFKFVWSIQEKKGDYFNGIRSLIAENRGIVRKQNADYLLFLLLESIVDNYYETLHQFNEDGLENMGESEIDPTPEFMNWIESRKKRLFLIKRASSSLRETLTKLEKVSGKFYKSKYFHELKEQVNNLISDIDFEMAMLESKMNMVFTLQGHRLNEVMKTLTIFSVVFIPITFIAGLYGMNFDFIPELKWKFGYFIALGVMLVITIISFIIFKKRKWF